MYVDRAMQATLIAPDGDEFMERIATRKRTVATLNPEHIPSMVTLDAIPLSNCSDDAVLHVDFVHRLSKRVETRAVLE
jgi:hypothetical protein